MEALRPVTQVLGFLSLLPPISDPVEKVVVVLPVQDSSCDVLHCLDMGMRMCLYLYSHHSLHNAF